MSHIIKGEDKEGSNIIAEIKSKIEILRGEIWELHDGMGCQDAYDNSFADILELLDEI